MILQLFAAAAAAAGAPGGGVLLHVESHQVVLDNGVVQVWVSKPQGQITAVRYGDDPGNLLHFTGRSAAGVMNSGGYWDLIWNFPGPGRPEGMTDVLDGTEFEVVSWSEEQVEVSFRSTYDPSRQDSVRLNVDKRLVMLRGSSGFYCYAILEHASEWPALNVSQVRLAFKLNPTRFNYMAVSDGIQRYMPAAADRDAPRGTPLAYQEAVLLVNASEPRFTGEVDDKYQYSLDNKDNHVHGWIAAAGDTTTVPMGFWIITPSNEFKSGGPTKRELTSHIGPTSVTMFLGTHYVGDDIVAKINAGEQWKKVLGPMFIYLNSSPNPNPKRGDFQFHDMWKDAKAQAKAEASKWPYSFPVSPDFHKAIERGSVTGRLLVRDRYVSGNDMPARLAYVGLAAPGQPGSWATESKGYQFWTRVWASNGSFAIGDVRAGEYNLYGWVPGLLGDYMYGTTITVASRNNVSLGDLVFEPPRSGRTLWEIGVPDRSAAEFFIPVPNPKYVNKLFLTKDRYRQYGLWERYADLYPAGDPIFTVGESHHSKDWFFAHVTRHVGTDEEASTARHIRFDLASVVTDGIYTLRVALAAAHYSRLELRVNGAPAAAGDRQSTPSMGLFMTPKFGDSNAIARHAEHGTWRSFEFKIEGRLLAVGENNINITQARVFNKFLGVMYDYLRLEAPGSHATSMNIWSWFVILFQCTTGALLFL